MTTKEERERRIESIATLQSHPGWLALRDLLEKKREKLRDELEGKPDEHKGGRACEIRDIIRMVATASEQVKGPVTSAPEPPPGVARHAYDA